jgi:hypothetical protein
MSSSSTSSDDEPPFVLRTMLANLNYREQQLAEERRIRAIKRHARYQEVGEREANSDDAREADKKATRSGRNRYIVYEADEDGGSQHDDEEENPEHGAEEGGLQHNDEEEDSQLHEEDGDFQHNGIRTASQHSEGSTLTLISSTFTDLQAQIPPQITTSNLRQVTIQEFIDTELQRSIAQIDAVYQQQTSEVIVISDDDSDVCLFDSV